MIAPRGIHVQHLGGDRRGEASAVERDPRLLSPACGVGDIVALTRYLTEDDAPTEVFLVDAATGAGTATFNNSDEVTSAVPLSSTTAVAVDGRQLLSLAGGKAKVEATLDQDGYDIVPVAGGGVDLLTASLADPTTAGVWHWQAGTGLEKIGKRNGCLDHHLLGA